MVRRMFRGIVAVAVAVVVVVVVDVVDVVAAGMMMKKGLNRPQ